MIAELLSILEIIGRMVLAAIGVTALLFAVLMVASWFDWTKGYAVRAYPSACLAERCRSL